MINKTFPYTFGIILRMTGMLFVLGSILALVLTGCHLPGSAAPTPFVFTTPDKTLTAIFAPLLSLTPEPPQAHTATPVVAQPSPFSTTTLSSTPVASDAPLPSPTVSAPKLRSAALIEANYLEIPPVLDGILDEWGMLSYPVRYLVYGAKDWEDEADASATTMLGWDSTYLYLAMHVRDDRYVQEASGLNIFKGDSLEILLDVDLEWDFEVKSLNADDHQLGISPGSPYPGQDWQAYLWFPSSRQGGRSDVSIAARAREGGYNVEVAVPWSLFGIEPTSGDSFGFALSVSDNDLPGEQVQQSMVSYVSTRNLADPTTWGSLLLIKP
jgi:hypothetical protein